MRIVHILPGSGGTFYCENCMRDSVLAKALRSEGVDVVLVPMYLPIYTDVPDLTQNVPVFFGGINVYLQQKYRFFRQTPRWLDKLFDSPLLLRAAAKRAGTTRARSLGAMTLSMLQGPAGNQSKELRRLVEWLAVDERPDLIHISTTMLLGLASTLHAELNVPIVCSMQDEDTWIDNTAPPYPELCWASMAEQARVVSAFVTPSHYYRGRMLGRLALAPERVHVVRTGLDTQGYQPSECSLNPPVLGYLSKFSPALGLDVLVDAFVQLKRRPGLQHLKLRATGGGTGDDALFVKKLISDLGTAGVGGDVEFIDSIDRASRQRFLASLTALCVPIPGGEAFGAFMLEAWASGVPVVEPRAGGFPELIELTGGGLVYEPEDTNALVETLYRLLTTPGLARELGGKARDVVFSDFNIKGMTAEMMTLYKRILSFQRAS